MPFDSDPFASRSLDRARLLRRAGLVAAAGAGVSLAEPGAARAEKGSFDVGDYGAVGDGEHDDTRAIQQAVDAAAAAGGTVVSPAGRTYRITSPITVAATCGVDFSSSRLKKADGWSAGYAVEARGPGVEIRRLHVDGNRTGGARGGGIMFLAPGGRLDESLIEACQGAGVAAEGADARLDCHRTACRDQATGSSSGDGFLALTGSVLRAFECVADENERSGFFFDEGVASGCHVDGRASRNGRAGVWIRGDSGTSDVLHLSDNASHNLYLDREVDETPGRPSDWHFGVVFSEHQGASADERSGSHVGLYGASRCTFGTVVTRGGGGWGVVLSRGHADAPGARHNTFGTVICDQEGGHDTDPGVSLQSGSQLNSFGTIVVRQHSLALAIGEEYGPFDNDHNTFGEVHAFECPWGAISIGGGSYNHVGRLVARGCGNRDPGTLLRGLVSFLKQTDASAADVRGNVVAYVDHKSTTAGMALRDVPVAVVWADPHVAENAVLDGTARDAHADVIDENGGNYVSLRAAHRVAQLDDFESGWVGGQATVIPGEARTGRRGLKVRGLPAPGGAKASKRVSLDLTDASDTDWFRVFAYVEGVADKHTSTPAFIRLSTDTGDYFEHAFSPHAIRTDGPVHLFARKGAFVSVGSPTWAAIREIALVVMTTGIGGFAISWDDLVRVSGTCVAAD